MTNDLYLPLKLLTFHMLKIVLLPYLRVGVPNTIVKMWPVPPAGSKCICMAPYSGWTRCSLKWVPHTTPSLQYRNRSVVFIQVVVDSVLLSFPSEGFSRVISSFKRVLYFQYDEELLCFHWDKLSAQDKKMGYIWRYLLYNVCVVFPCPHQWLTECTSCFIWSFEVANSLLSILFFNYLNFLSLSFFLTFKNKT